MLLGQAGAGLHITIGSVLRCIFTNYLQSQSCSAPRKPFALHYWDRLGLGLMLQCSSGAPCILSCRLLRRSLPHTAEMGWAGSRGFLQPPNSSAPRSLFVLCWPGLAVALRCAASHVSLQLQCHGLPELQHSKQSKSQADLALLDGPQDRVQDGQKGQR